MSNGEKIPCSASTVTVELMGSAVECVDREMVEHAASAVLHYFQNDLHRTSVTLGEFTEALEVALRGMGLQVSCDPVQSTERTVTSDLRLLATESGKIFELGFFARLRDEVRQELRWSPRLIRFLGLRSCVKQLAGAKRWCPRCERLSDQIVEFLRGCVTQENPPEPCGLLVL